ncbi:MAG TPA: Wzz/FepE/Etk N-terminal domain-containing protein, partial [Actinomycetota bacterium]
MLRLRKWSIIAITLLALLAAVFYTKQQTPIYTSKISVVTNDPLSQVFGNSRGVNLTVETSLVTALPVLQCAQQILANPADDKLGADLTTICATSTLEKVAPENTLKKHLKVSVPVGTTSAPQTSSLFYIQFSDPSLRRAQAVTQAFALSYQFYKVQSAEQQLTTMTDPVNKQLSDVNKSLTKVNNDISNLTGQLATASTKAQGAQIQAEIDAKDAQRTTLTGQSGALESQLANLAPSRIVPPQVPAPASLPTSPSSPKLV